jgi:hypothetical protein
LSDYLDALPAITTADHALLVLHRLIFVILSAAKNPEITSGISGSDETQDRL